MTVKDLKLLQGAEIVEITADDSLVRRLNDMGFRPGQMVELVGRAPMSGPYLVRSHGATFALREGEADCIHVKAPSRSS